MSLNLPILMVELGWKWLGIDSFCNYNSIVLCQFCDKQGRKKYCWWMLFLGHRTLTSRCFLKQLGSEDMLACVIFYNFFHCYPYLIETWKGWQYILYCLETKYNIFLTWIMNVPYLKEMISCQSRSIIIWRSINLSDYVTMLQANTRIHKVPMTRPNKVPPTRCPRKNVP